MTKFKKRPARRKELTIGVASDHAGFEMKQYLSRVLEREGVRFVDLGPANTDQVDYPDFAAAVGRGMTDGTFNAGLLCCGSGQGMVITANRFPAVRATLCLFPEQARVARQHNDSNVLVMGGRVTSKVTAAKVVREWLDTQFEGGRHQTRLEKIDTATAGTGRKAATGGSKRGSK